MLILEQQVYFIQMKEQGFHQEGIREGLTTYYYDNGVMQREGFFKAGLPDGIWTYWNSKGEKDFDFDLVLIQCGCFYEAVDDGAEFLNKHFKLKLHGANHYTAGFPEQGLGKYKKLLDQLNSTVKKYDIENAYVLSNANGKEHIVALSDTDNHQQDYEIGRAHV